MKVWMAPHGLHIGYGEPQDAAQLARLHAQGFYRGWPVSDFEAYLAAPKITPCYIAMDARRNISGFALIRTTGDEAELLTIAVDKWRRKKGIGQALLRAVFDDLRHSPVRSIFLEVADDNNSAIGLYRRHGFADIGTRKGYYPRPDGSAATALVMRADLG